MAELVEDQDGAPYPEQWQPFLQQIRDDHDAVRAMHWVEDAERDCGVLSMVATAARVAYSLREG